MFSNPNLHVAIDDKPILKGLSLAVHPGQPRGVVGLCGSTVWYAAGRGGAR